MSSLHVVKAELVLAELQVKHVVLSQDVEHIVVDAFWVEACLRSEMLLQMFMQHIDRLGACPDISYFL